jgi:hypothetical protein
MATRKASNKAQGALGKLAAQATKHTSAQAIALMIGANGKSVRTRVRAGTLHGSDGATLPAVYVSKSQPLTDAHKRAIVHTFVRDDEHAQAIIGAQ